VSLHLEAVRGSVADAVLLPGDPLRAKFIADKYLEGAVCYNQRRAAYGFTGRYDGCRVSVQATGMGVPSISIYVHELVCELGARVLIRVGTCGSMQPDVRLGDIVVAQAACTDSSINGRTFCGMTYSPIADFELLRRFHALALSKGVAIKVGNVLTTDLFYQKDEGWFDVWAAHGVLAAEMETSALYTLAAKNGVRALSVLTISDMLTNKENMPPEDRERSLDRMIQLALDLSADVQKNPFGEMGCAADERQKTD